MKLKLIAVVSMLFLPMTATIAKSLYCPQNHAYIKIGMTKNEVINACGPPYGKQQPNLPVTKKVPMTQLLYHGAYPIGIPGYEPVFNMWSLTKGSGGMTLEVDIVKNKVVKVRINGSNSNTFSICQGANIQEGDSINSVYNACGNPSETNHTFTEQLIQSNDQPEIWFYQPTPYQPTTRLTFVNGKLQSID